jgi:cytochrome c peroxidase
MRGRLPAGAARLRPQGARAALAVAAVTLALVAVAAGLARADPAATDPGDTRRPRFTAEEQARIATHGPWPPPIPADPGNRFSGVPAAERLGERLFHDASLAGAGGSACSGCHRPAQGFSDARALAIGREPLARNTQGLLDVGLQRWFGWDGGADSLWAASLRPLLDPREMGASPAGVAARLRQDPALATALAAARRAAPGGSAPPDASADEIDLVDAAKAIGAWLRTQVSPRTPFDDFRDAIVAGDATRAARYPDAAARGLRLFLDHGRCAACHTGPGFSNGEFHDIGMPFVSRGGRVDPGRHAGLRRVLADRYNLIGDFADRAPPTEAADDPALKLRTVAPLHRNFGEWRTPGLRGLGATAPYMHDGRLPGLADVIRHYDMIDVDRLHSDGEALLRPLRLSATERADLLAFLRSLEP